MFEREDNPSSHHTTPDAEGKEEATPTRRRRLTRSSMSDQLQAANQNADQQKAVVESEEEGLKRVAHQFCKFLLCGIITENNVVTSPPIVQYRSENSAEI